SPVRRLTLVRSLAARRLRTVPRSFRSGGGCARPPILCPPIRGLRATPERAGKHCRQARRPNRTEKLAQLFPLSSGIGRDLLHPLSSYFPPLDSTFQTPHSFASRYPFQMSS